MSGWMLGSGLRYLDKDISLSLDSQACTGCGVCLEVCPHAVFEMDGKKARIQDRGACMECGACAKNCRFGAIKVKAGVGCAAAVINGILTGGEPDCGCGAGCDSGSKNGGKKSGKKASCC